MAIVSKKTYDILAQQQEARQILKTEKEDTLSDFKKRRDTITRALNAAKYAKPQDTARCNELNEALETLNDEQEKYLFNWNQRFKDTNDPYKLAQRDVRKESQEISDAMSQQMWGNVKQAAGTAKDTIKSNSSAHSGNLTDSFYRDVAAAFSGRQPGNAMNDNAATAKAQAKNQQTEAANRQMEAQKSQQIADRNEYTEAGKVASMQNDAQNRQNIANREGMSGAAAALTRQTNTPDIATERARQDQQRNIANNRRQEADIAQQGSTQSQGQAMEFQHKADEYDADYDSNIKLNQANENLINAQTDYFKSLAKKNEPEAVDNISEAVDTTPAKTVDTTPEAVDNTPSDLDTTGRPESDIPEDNEYHPSTDNKVSGAGYYKQFLGDDAKLFEAIVADAQKLYKDNYEAQKNYYENQLSQLMSGNALSQFLQNNPYPAQTVENQAQANKEAAAPDESDDLATKLKKEAMRKFPNPEDFEARKNYYENQLGLQMSGKELQNFLANNPYSDNDNSDEHLKNIQRQMSDCRMKWIKNSFDKYGSPSAEDFAWLMGQAGKHFTHNGQEYDFDDVDENDDTVLKGYAEFIRNYVYNYKPEAMQVDSRNDPNVTHIGPMAQDIEKVNPACISKDENGIESVDTGRLALMNAGAVGDLARSLEDIKTRLARLEAQNG